MDGKRDFKIVISDVGEGHLAAILRCPECGSKKCKLSNANVFHGGLTCSPNENGFSIGKSDPDGPKTNGVNMVMICEEGHLFWYWFHTSGFNTLITHGVIGTSVESEIG